LGKSSAILYLIQNETNLNQIMGLCTGCHIISWTMLGRWCLASYVPFNVNDEFAIHLTLMYLANID
jgi:hypothetical protein